MKYQMAPNHVKKMRMAQMYSRRRTASTVIQITKAPNTSVAGDVNQPVNQCQISIRPRCTPREYAGRAYEGNTLATDKAGRPSIRHFLSRRPGSHCARAPLTSTLPA